MKNNIALIGFMGAGKSVTGRALAQVLKREFVDTDETIEKKAGMTISAIFAQQGEDAFRDLESEAVRQACSGQERVIACGGGTVLRQKNIEVLRGSALIIYLAARPEAILQRVGDGKTRPLLKEGNRSATMTELLRARQPLYEKAADIIIDTTDIDTSTVVKKILSELDRYEGYHLQKQRSG